VPANQAAVWGENASVINYTNSGASANYVNDRAVPGFSNDQDEYVIEATATITIPAAGSYTFGVNSDDGFKLTIGNTVEQCDCLRGPADSLQVFNFAAPGIISSVWSFSNIRAAPKWNSSPRPAHSVRGTQLVFAWSAISQMAAWLSGLFRWLEVVPPSVIGV